MRTFARLLTSSAALLSFACSTVEPEQSPQQTAQQPLQQPAQQPPQQPLQQVAGQPAPPIPVFKRSLASFAKSNANQQCFDRKTEPYTAVTDAHFHPRPFGGQAIEPTTLFEIFDKTGVRFVNYFGIGQSLDMASTCTYYLDCPGTSALPSIKNDFVNGEEVKVYPHDNLHIILSMTFFDLAHPEGAVETHQALRQGISRACSNGPARSTSMKQALLGNKHEPATMESIDRWAPFMKVLRERGIPLTLHSDLGNDANPTQFVYLMQHVLQRYPDNKIVWAHMGLSKELVRMNPGSAHRAHEEGARYLSQPDARYFVGRSLQRLSRVRRRSSSRSSTRTRPGS